MNAYVANTDHDWFDFLSAQREVDEVNFWMPRPWGGQFAVLQRGEPLLFKLKSPRNAIAGGGFLERYVELPISLAWQAFGPKNGAPTYEIMRNRISRLRGEPTRPWEDYRIGCILLVEPFFWAPELWIPEVPGWARQIQRGKSYDLTQGAGRHIWNQVAERLRATPESEGIADSVVHPGGYTDPLHQPRRLGQGTFQIAVTETYQRSCAITRERALPALDAAHIQPFSERPKHEISNGLLLRSDVHRLFDAGYLTVTPEYRVEASETMRDDFNDGDNYLALHGAPIWVPEDPVLRPAAERLRWHNEERFRG